MPATYVSTDGDRVAAEPTSAELTHLTHTIARRVGRSLERLGLLERDAENSYLTGDGVERGHWSRPHERPLSVFGLACGYPPRMAGHGTLEPVDVALQEAALETLLSFAPLADTEAMI
jgi:hypothetical protein